MDVLLSWTREINHHTKNMMISVINTKRGKLFMGNIFKRNEEKRCQKLLLTPF